MKRKRILLLFIFFVMFLTACGPVISLQETRGTDPTVPSAPDNPDPPRPEIPWERPEIGSAPSYEEYFSQVVDYVDLTQGPTFPSFNYISYDDLDNHRLTYESPHLYLDNYDGERLWEVAEIPDLRVVLYDPYWIYAIEGGTDLFRMDYYGENKELLFRDETGLINELNSSFYLADGKVMYFFAGDADGGTSIYRLYLPEMKLDTMYHYDSAAWESYFFAAPSSREQLSGNEDTVASYHIGACVPVSNHEVIWNSYNPEFYVLLRQLAADPELYNHYFGDSEMEFAMCISGIEADYQTLHQTDHYYNSLTDSYLSKGTGVLTGGGDYEVWWKAA